MTQTTYILHTTQTTHILHKTQTIHSSHNSNHSDSHSSHDSNHSHSSHDSNHSHSSHDPNHSNSSHDPNHSHSSHDPNNILNWLKFWHVCKIFSLWNIRLLLIIVCWFWLFAQNYIQEVKVRPVTKCMHKAENTHLHRKLFIHISIKYLTSMTIQWTAEMLGIFLPAPSVSCDVGQYKWCNRW